MALLAANEANAAYNGYPREDMLNKGLASIRREHTAFAPQLGASGPKAVPEQGVTFHVELGTPSRVSVRARPGSRSCPPAADDKLVL